jgi:hypothetical protein
MSFLDYRIHPLVLLSLTVLPRPSLVHEFFRVWARLTSSFQHHVACFERQLWFRACILSIVPMTSTSSFPAWRRRCLISFSWKLPANVSWSPSTLYFFRDVNCVHGEKYPPYPSMIVVIIDNPFDFISSRACPCYGWNLPSCLYCVLPWSITALFVKYVVRIAPPRWNSWQSDTSRHHRSFLVPVLILTGIPICKRHCLDSVLLATLLLWS